MSKKVLSVPAAARTFNALRDLGYDLNSAVADVVDNSISRGKAKNIHIYFKKDSSNKFYLWICDDGSGMGSDELEKAMKLGGSTEEYDSSDLSKYGMGMKTASLSQAFKLTVLSKRKGHQIAAFAWDMHHVNKADKWEMFRLDKGEVKKKMKSLLGSTDAFAVSYFKKLFGGQSWTIVIWDDLKDFQANHDSYESDITANNYYHREIDKLKIYLRLVFGRFLSGENGARRISLHLANQRLGALDPFCRSQRNTLEMPLSKRLGEFVISKGVEPIRIKRYVLPTNPSKPGQFKFSTSDSWEEAKGTRSWNEAQGYYVYRNNRLISWGGWYKTKTVDEHDKLARASIDLTREHDSLFKLDVKKTKIQFPETLRIHLQDNVNKGFISEAKKRYAGSEKGSKKIPKAERENDRKVNLLATDLLKNGKISVVQKGKDNVVIYNKYGIKVSHDMTFKELEAGQKLVPKRLGSSQPFWRMVASPESKFQVVINSDHPFYKFVYGSGKSDKRAMAIVNAFLFTMSFVEIKCIANSNEHLFDQMREVASTVLGKFVKKKILK